MWLADSKFSLCLEYNIYWLVDLWHRPTFLLNKNQQPFNWGFYLREWLHWMYIEIICLFSYENKLSFCMFHLHPIYLLQKIWQTKNKISFASILYTSINKLYLIIILTVHKKSLGVEYYLKNKLCIDSTKQIWIELRNPSFISQTLIKSNLNSVFLCKGKYLMLRSGPLRQLSSCCLGVGHMKRSTAGIKRWG